MICILYSKGNFQLRSQFILLWVWAVFTIWFDSWTITKPLKLIVAFTKGCSECAVKCCIWTNHIFKCSGEKQIITNIYIYKFPTNVCKRGKWEICIFPQRFWQNRNNDWPTAFTAHCGINNYKRKWLIFSNNFLRSPLSNFKWERQFLARGK